MERQNGVSNDLVLICDQIFSAMLLFQIILFPDSGIGQEFEACNAAKSGIDVSIRELVSHILFPAGAWSSFRNHCFDS